MAFAKIEKTSRSGKGSNAQAAISISEQGAGTLRINASGMDFLRGNAIELKGGDYVEIYHDPKSDELAISRDPAGSFCITHTSSKKTALRINSSDLAKKVGENKTYRLKRSRKFDVVLFPYDERAGVA